VRQSEDLLIAANALVGVATANFYPSISLTGLLGVQHSAVSSILSGTSSIWSLGAGLLGPLFTGGQLTGELEAQEAQWRRVKASYEQTVLTALAEVSDALNGREKLAGVREQREVAVREFASSVDLSLDRYLLGLASYFEVLQTQEQLYSTQLALARTQGEQLVNVVELYRALGGGWQTPATGDRTAGDGAAPAAARN
jgi:multidrug efflux system outer membrane protein